MWPDLVRTDSEGERGTDYHVIISIPLFHRDRIDKERPSSQEIIGILNIASDSPGSRFLKLMDLPEQERARDLLEIRTVCHAILDKILRDLLTH
jgi:hypothetical protein